MINMTIFRWLAVVLAFSSASCFAADTFTRALEFHRRGNCKEATPLLQQLAEQQPRNQTIRRLLATCGERQNAAAKRGLRDARAAAAGKPATVRAALNRKSVGTNGAAQPGVKTPSAAVVATTRSASPRKRITPAAKPTPESTPNPLPPAPVITADGRERAAAGRSLVVAEILIKSKRMDEAEPVLENLIAEKSDLGLPRLRLAEIYSAKKKFPEAAAQYGWLADHEGNAEYRLRQAQNFSWGKRYDDAAVSYQKYLERNREDAEAQLGLAQVLFWSDRLPESAVAFDRYLELKPDDAEARLNLGRAQLWSGKADQAYENLARARADLPKDIMIDLLVAKALEQSTKPEQALEVYQMALANDPKNKEAKEGYDRVTGLVLLRSGYAKQEKNDFNGALQAFTKYLERNPDEEKILLQVGRLHSWSNDHKRAVPYYEAYLKKQPKDETAQRELGKAQITIPDFEAAQKTYASLVTTSAKPRVEDYEGLVNAHVWNGHFDAAQPFVRKLMEIDPGNAVARRAYVAINETRRLQELEKAQRLASGGKYKLALEAYRKYTAEFGATWEIELNTARIYGWNRQTPKAVQAYQEYLQRYPEDVPARLELADLERWSGKLDAAEYEYKEIARKQPKNPQALFGMAQIADLRGTDRFSVYTAYRNVLALDPGHQTARQRLTEIVPAVSPSVQFKMNNFHDSDDFGRQVSTVEVGIPFRGGLKLSPMVRHGYFNQFREIGGGICGAGQNPSSDSQVTKLSEDICAKRGAVQGLGGGIGFELAPNPKFAITGEVAAMKLNTPQQRLSLNAKGEVVVHPKPDYTLVFGATHRDALYDVNTIGSLFAGIMHTSLIVSYEQPLSDRWRIWLAGGVSRYTAGTQKAFEPNQQRRFSARTDYHVLPWMTAGYYVRVTGFQEFSPLYFSPEFYGTTGFRYFWEKPIAKGVRSVGEMELGYGRINRYDIAGVNTAEFSLYSGIAWDIRPDLTLRFGYRYGRGRSSSFGSPVYSSGVADFGMSNYWTPAMPAISPNRIEIR